MSSSFDCSSSVPGQVNLLRVKQAVNLGGLGSETSQITKILATSAVSKGWIYVGGESMELRQFCADLTN